MTVVSVITPSFNQRSYLQACLDSVAAQRGVEVEHIVFDPGSTDGSRDIASAHAARNSFVRYIEEPDDGQVDAINKGLAMATGDVLTWLNSDDAYLDSNVLKLVLDEFDANPDADVVYGRGMYVAPDGSDIQEAWVHRDGSVIPERLRDSIGILQPSLFFRRRVYEKVGGLDPTYNLSLDYDYWIRFALGGATFHFVDELLSRATMHRDSKTVGSRGDQYDEILQLLQGHFGRPDPVWIDRAASHRATGRDGMFDASDEMTFGQAARYRYHHAKLRRQFLPEAPQPPKALVVTTFDAPYFEQGLNLVAGLHRTSMESIDRIVVFDLGLEEGQREHLNGCDLVTVVDYHDEVQGFFEGYMSPKNYSYKCAAIKQAGDLVDDGAVVLFMDAGIVPLRSIREIIERTMTDGVFFVDHGDVPNWPIHNIQFTSEESLAAMGASIEESLAEHLCSCLIGYAKGGPFQRLIDEAYELSQDSTVVVAPKHLSPEDRVVPRSGPECDAARAALLQDPSAHSRLEREELRRLFGYFGHRQDQSIYSVLAARYGAEQQPARRYNSSNHASSRASKLNWKSQGVSQDYGVTPSSLDSTDDGTVIYHHRGTFSNLDGLQHNDRTSDCIFILGNGPSLASIDLSELDGLDTLGMNAAYRHWHKIGWYPTYYSCMDTVVMESHADEIASLVRDSDRNGIRRFFLRDAILETHPELEGEPRVMFLEREAVRRSDLGVEPITTGSHSLIWARALGYTRMFLLGVDLNYVEILAEAELADDGTLAIASKVDHNPNYFFAGYQAPGDRYNVPNPNPGLHERAWAVAAAALPSHVDVFNLNPNSALGTFETREFTAAIQEATVTRRSVVRTWAPPSRRAGLEGELLGPFDRGQARFSESDAIHAYLSKSLEEPGVMIDVGAHFGGSLRPFADDGWKVYGFEPDPNNRAGLAERTSPTWDLSVDTRAVSYIDGMTLPFYRSPESTGVSGLSPFLDSHEELQRVTTVTLNSFLAEHGIDRVDFLKIDTEGHDIDVLEGYPWNRSRPQVVLCEFENQKTERIGYQTEELAAFLHDKGYEVLLSEWHPVVRYGVQHDFRALRRWEPGVAHVEAWGNLIGVRSREAADDLVEVSESFIMRLVPRDPEPNPTPVATSSTVRGMARRILDRRTAILLRLVRWYISPSGLLFLLALGLGVAALVNGGRARWYGLAALVLLSIFVPYRFSREQVRSDRRLEERTRGLERAVRAVVEREASQRSSEIGVLRDASAGLSNRVDVIGRTVDASMTRLSSAERGLESAMQRLGDAEDALASVKEDAGRTSQLLNEADARSIELREMIGRLEGTIDRLDAETVRLDAETVRLESTADKQSADGRRLREDLLTERTQRIDAFASAVDTLSRSRSLTSANDDYGDPLRESAVSDAMKGRRLIFAASSGRSGSHYLAQLLGTAEHVHATHEAPPYMIGHHLTAVLDRPLHLTYDQRRIKATAIRATLAGLPRHIVYAEANHMFIKTFHDVVLNEFDPAGLSVVCLRRRIDKVLKSILELGYFKPDNSDWPQWMHVPHGVNLLARPPDPIGELDDVDRAIGYLFDIEARMQRLPIDYPKLNIVQVNIDQISTTEGAEMLFRDLHLESTDRTQAIVGRPTNARTAGKLGEVDLAECRARIIAYYDRAQHAGVFVPDLGRLLED